MAHHPNHVPLTADSPGSAAFGGAAGGAGGEAYAQNVAISGAQDASFEGAWQPHSTERIDLGSEAGFWQPSIDATHSGLHNTNNNNHNHHQNPSYFQQHNTTQSAYPSEHVFDDYNRASFNPAASLLSPGQQHQAPPQQQQQQQQQHQQQPFRSHAVQTQFNDAQVNTIAPNVLQTIQSPVQHPNSNSNTLPAQRPPSTSHSTAPKHQYAPLVPLPPGAANGSRFVLTALDELSKLVRVKSLAAFTDIGLEPVAEIARSTIPAYNARRSRNEIKALLASNSKLSASISKKKKLGALVQTKKPVQLDASGQLATRATSISESSSELESDYESSDDEEEPSPLPARRPDTSSGATEYDTIKALWRPRNRILTVVEIREGLKAFWEVVQTIRERWNSDRTAVKQAEEKKKENELPMLKERVAKQREMLEIALGSAVKHGHPDIVKHFGENLAMMGALAVFLLDRSKESDYSGSFVRAILELLIRCTTLTDGNLEKSNIGKMLTRFSRRGDADVKSLAKKISDNAMTATKKKKEAAKAGAGSASSSTDSKQPDAADAKPSSVAGVKRERTADSSDPQPVKKLAGPSPLSKATAKDASPAKAPAGANGQPATSTSTTASKPKTNTVTPKASGFFSLQSASKRPGTSIAAQQAAAAAAKNSSATTPVAAVAAAAAASAAASAPTAASAATIPAAASGGDSRSFSVFNFIEESKKPEAKPKAKAEEKRAPESAEERAKRERKEKRRHLRVHWKPEAALVDVRLFSHDPEEELGHDASQVRHVGDIGSEGAMFKMQHRHETEMIDDEEDEEAEAEAAKLFGRDYPALLAVDFGELREKEPDQHGMLFAPYGGGTKEPESAESKTQQQRETDVLAVYYNKTDLPPPDSAQEPVEEAAQADGEPTAFGEAPAEVLSRIAANDRREQGRDQPQFPQQAQQQQQQAQFDLAAILGSIGAQQPPPPPQQQPPPVSHATQPQAALSALDQALSQIRNKQAAPSIPAQPAQFDLAAVLASLGGHQPQSQPAPPAPMPPQHTAATTAAPPVPPAAGADLAAILQGLSSAPQMPQVPGMPSLKGYMAQGGFPLGAMSQNQNQQQQQQQQQQPNGSGSGYPYENEERKRWREQHDSMNGMDGNNDDAYSNKRQKWNNSGSSSNINTNNTNINTSSSSINSNPAKALERGGRPPPQFVVECRYFQEGKCKKGKDCTYLHNGVPASQQHA